MALAHRGDQDVRLAGDFRQIFGAAVANGDSAILMEQQHGHGLSHDVAAADDNTALALHRDLVSL